MSKNKHKTEESTQEILEEQCNCQHECHCEENGCSCNEEQNIEITTTDEVNITSITISKFTKCIIESII